LHDYSPWSYFKLTLGLMLLRVTNGFDDLLCAKTNLEIFICLMCGSILRSGDVDVKKKMYFLCKNCNSKYERLGDLPACKRCGSSRLLLLTRYIKTCKFCGSEKILPLSQLKALVLKRARQVIAVAREVLNSVSSLVRRFEKIKGIALEARSAGFHHFPIIELSLKKFSDRLRDIKLLISQKLHRILNDMLACVEFLGGSNGEKMVLAMEKSKSLIDEIENIKNEISNVKDKLMGELFEISIPIYTLYYNSRLFSRYGRFIRLQNHEKPIFVLDGILTTRSDGRKSVCMVILTNMRIIALQIDKYYKVPRIFCEYELMSIKGMREMGVLRRILLLKFSNGSVKFQSSPEILKLLREYMEIALNYENYSIKEPYKEVFDKITVSIEDLDKMIVEFEEKLRNAQKVGTKESKTKHDRMDTSRAKTNLVREVNGRKSYLEMRKKELISLLEELERKFKEGIISVEDYFRYYRTWMGELYSINAQLGESDKTSEDSMHGNLNIVSENKKVGSNEADDK